MFPEKVAAADKRKRTRASYTEQDGLGSRSPDTKLVIYRGAWERKNLSYRYMLHQLIAWNKNKVCMGGAV